jgi:hypothetical protein
MPDPNRPHASATADVVITYRVAPVIYWVMFGAMSAFMALVIVMAFEPDPAAPPMGWFDWIGYALVVAAGAFFAWAPSRIAMTWLTLGADGSVRIATRTPFAARERRLEPGSVARVELRRNYRGVIAGWQVILHWTGGGRLVVNERWNAAAQLDLAQELERRLGLVPGP